MAITHTTGETFPAGASVVTATKLNNIVNNMTTTIATGKVLGRTTAGTGAVEELAITGTGSVVLATSPTLVTPALGTPASGIITNLTGTASININGTVGATTPSSVAATTVSATGVISTSAASGIVFAAGSTGYANTYKGIGFTDTAGTDTTIFGCAGSGTPGIGLTALDSFVYGPTAFAVDIAGAVYHRVTTSGTAITGTLSATGVISNTDATDASSSTTGALKTAGGLGVAKKLYVGTDITAPFIKQSVGDCRVTSDFTKTADTSLADVTGLSVALAAGGTYSFEASLFATQSGSGGYTFGTGGTATATAMYGSYTVHYGPGSLYNDSITGMGGGTVVAVGGAAYLVLIRGTITVNAGGTLTITFAQASATGSSTVKRGSYMTVRQY